MCTELFEVNLFDYQIGGWLVSKKNKNKIKEQRKKKKENPWPIVPSLNRDKKLNANSAMPRCVFEAEFRFCQDLRLVLNQMKSGVGGNRPIVRDDLRGPHQG